MQHLFASTLYFLIFILFIPEKQTPENAGRAFSGAYFQALVISDRRSRLLR
jgi:hypothetical protein